MSDKNFMANEVDALLLAAVRGEAAHGYEIIERLRDRSGGAFELAEGTVYPALHRLERGGLLDSHWEQHAGRKRRVYRLNASGVVALEAMTRRWEQYAQGMRAVLEGHL